MLKLIKTFFRSIVYFLFGCLYFCFRIFPIQKNKLFIQNLNGKGYGDNPKYIVEEILRRNLDLKIVWAVMPNFSRNFPENVKIVRYRSIRAIFEEATAKIWIDNCRKQLYVQKRKNQYYIQTWHGGPNVLKRIEKDAGSSLILYYVTQAKHDSSIINLFLSCEKDRVSFYNSTFWYNGEIFDCGSPCDDIFFTSRDEIKDKVYSSFSLDKSKKIILYAPTFRNNFDPDVFDLDYYSILDFLSQKTHDQWVFLVRMHPNLTKKAGFIKYTDTIINASNYDDTQEIMYASDILISDYSGVILEFSMMKKPVFLYAKDYKSYVSERNFYYDLFSLPYPVAQSNAELISNISQFNDKSYKKKLDDFFKKIKLTDNGSASEKVVDRIMEKINEIS